MDKTKYEVKGTMTFAYIGGEIAYFTDDYEHEWEKFYANRTTYDLMSGEKFVSCVDCGGFIDYDGSIADIFVDGYKSNLGLCHKGITQGGFLVDKETFLDICSNHKVEVNWANK